MIDFNQIDSAKHITPEFILSKVTERQIFNYYFGNFDVNSAYPSKFRRDRSPSTGFYVNAENRILYNDFKTGEKHNCFTFVAKLYNIKYGEALKKIAADFGLTRGNNTPAFITNFKDEPLVKKERIIQIEEDNWQSHHIAYWKQYEISVDDLKKENVYPVKKLFIDKSEKSVEELCFAYLVEEKIKGKVVKTYLKIYQPYSERYKWLSNVPLTVPFGLSSLRYGTDHCIIGKAQKDRLILLKLFESVIGTQNESEAALPDHLVKHLTFHFPRRTIIWDADETGVTNCTKFNSRGFGYFNTPKCYLDRGIKDVSDYVKTFGLKALEILLKEKQIL